MERLNTLGLSCPEPLMLLRPVVRKMNKGDVLEVVADDPATTRDIPDFCRMMGHKLLSAEIKETPYLYQIEC